jgi:hypothetical protein
MLRRQLKGDLDCIVMKALEKDRGMRYQTVSDLQLDIERHLTHNVVLARRASAAHRFKKCIKRNMLAFTAAMTLILGLTASGVLLLVLVNALREAEKAEERANIFQAQTRYIAALNLFRSSHLGPLERQGANVTASLLSDQTFHVHVTFVGDADLSILKGAPISRLSITDPKFSNVLQLGGLHLRVLDIRNTRATDLRPLVGMELEEVYVDDCAALHEVPVLNGMPIRILSMCRTAVSDLGPIAGLPIKDLRISGTPVANISSLRGMRLQTLYLDSTNVIDLTPLRDMPIEVLWINNTDVHDISALDGSALKILNTARCLKLRELSPLRNASNLEQITLPVGATGLGSLRHLPHLRFISFDEVTLTGKPMETAEEFWRKNNDLTN